MSPGLPPYVRLHEIRINGERTHVLVIFRISCAVLATCWREVEEWFAWLLQFRNCSGSTSHARRCRLPRRTCRTTCPLSARQYNLVSDTFARRPEAKERTRLRETYVLQEKRGCKERSGRTVSRLPSLSIELPSITQLRVERSGFLFGSRDRVLGRESIAAKRTETIDRNFSTLSYRADAATGTPRIKTVTSNSKVIDATLDCDQP